MISQRAGGEVNERRAFGNLFVFGLNHAADDADNGVKPGGQTLLFEGKDTAQVGKNLFRGFFSDMAGVENNQIRRFGAGSGRVAQRFQNTDNPLRVINVHLAAESFDIILFFTHSEILIILLVR